MYPTLRDGPAGLLRVRWGAVSAFRESRYQPISDRPLDLDQVRVVGRGAAGRGAVLGQHVGAAVGVGAVTARRYPGAFLDRDDARRDAAGDLHRRHRPAAVVADAHPRAVRE